MIMGCYPRYSRVTTHDHGIAFRRAGMGRVWCTRAGALIPLLPGYRGFVLRLRAFPAAGSEDWGPSSRPVPAQPGGYGAYGGNAAPGTSQPHARGLTTKIVLAGKPWYIGHPVEGKWGHLSPDSSDRTNLILKS